VLTIVFENMEILGGLAIFLAYFFREIKLNPILNTRIIQFNQECPLFPHYGAIHLTSSEGCRKNPAFSVPLAEISKTPESSQDPFQESWNEPPSYLSIPIFNGR
jgi:hypothetical protein